MYVKDFHNPGLGRFDAAPNLFLRRELEHVRSKVYEVVYSLMKGRQLVPIDNSVARGAQHTTYNVMDMKGKARVGSDYTSEPPRFEVDATDHTQGVKGIVGAYGYSMNEIEAAILAGRGLSDRKGKAARSIMEREVDDILLDGNSANKLAGLFSLSGTQTETVTDGAVGTLWGTKNSDEKVADMNACADKVWVGSKERFAPDTLVIPTSAYTDIKNTRMGDGSNTKIIDYFLDGHDYIERIIPSGKLETAGAGGTRRMMAYNNSAEYLQGIIPIEFEQLSPQLRGFETIINCQLRIGGIELYQPLSVCYLDAF